MEKYLTEHNLLINLYKLETKIFPCMEINTETRISMLLTLLDAILKTFIEGNEILLET